MIKISDYVVQCLNCIRNDDTRQQKAIQFHRLVDVSLFGRTALKEKQQPKRKKTYAVCQCNTYIKWNAVKCFPLRYGDKLKRIGRKLGYASILTLLSDTTL